MSRDSGLSMNSLQTGFSGDTGSLPSSLMGAHNDWEIAPMDIEILRREDGSPWELGAGAFGKVINVSLGWFCSRLGSHTLAFPRMGLSRQSRWACHLQEGIELSP